MSRRAANLIKMRWWRQVPFAFVFTTFMLFTAFLASAIIGIERNVIIEADTSRLSLVFEGSSNAWSFSQVTLCAYEGPPPRDAAQDRHAPCPAYSAPPDQRQFWTLDWPELSGATVDIRPDGALAVTIGHIANDASDDPISPVDLPPRSILYIAPEDWAAHGAFTFQAAATIGEAMRPGLANYLHDGRWEFRQSSLATSLFRSSTELVKEGTLARGAAVTVHDWENDDQRRLSLQRHGDRQPAQMFGHLSPRDEPGGPPSFAVVAISEPGLTELGITYFGLRDEAVVKPDIVDLAIASPIFIAAIAFLSLLAAVTQVLGSLFFRTVDRGADDLQDQSDHANIAEGVEVDIIKRTEPRTASVVGDVSVELPSNALPTDDIRGP